MAKQDAAVKTVRGKPVRRKILRKLEKVQSSHREVEQKVSKLRARLERTEAALARRAQRLLTLQQRLDAMDTTKAPVPAPPDGVVQDSGEILAVEAELHGEPTGKKAASVKRTRAAGPSATFPSRKSGHSRGNHPQA